MQQQEIYTRIKTFRDIESIKSFMLDNYIDIFAYQDNSLLYADFDKYIKDNNIAINDDIYEQEYENWVTNIFDPFEDYPIDFRKIGNNQMLVFNFCFEKLAIVKHTKNYTLYQID